MPSSVVADVEASEPGFGLRTGVLSWSETLAQSISAIAPSTSAALTVPLVFALAGEGTCAAYLIAMVCMVPVALCVMSFARDEASPGSLYVYAQRTLPPGWAALIAWSLCFAYLASASSVLGGFVSFAQVLLGSAGRHVPAAVLATVAAGLAMWVAYRDVELSARLMLWIEAVSLLLIVLVIGVVVVRHGWRVDWPQVRLRGVPFASVRLGVVLAIFSFVGFESATALGTEAREPLRTISRAVLGSTLGCGFFFVLCAYGEVVGFRGAPTGLGENAAPMRYLATKAGLGVVGPVIDAGVMVSMFAATLAFIIALARMFMLMAKHGLMSEVFARTSARHRTPAVGGWLAGVVALLPAAVLVGRGSHGADVYGWMGSLGVFGFLTSYGLIAVAMVIHQRQRRRAGWRTWVLAGLAVAAMVAVGVGTLYPVPSAPFCWFPVVYAGSMVCAMGWNAWVGGCGRVSVP